MVASINQKLGEGFEVTVAGGTEGGFTRTGEIANEASAFLQRQSHTCRIGKRPLHTAEIEHAHHRRL